MSPLDLFGGGGLSASSSASTGPFQGGDVGGSSYSFGGINTGTQQQIPTMVWIVAAVALVLVFGRKR